MRRTGLLAAAVAVLAVRLVPGLAARLSAGCARCMRRMPDEFPPKRMAADLARIREQNEEILRLLNARVEASPAPSDPAL